MISTVLPSWPSFVFAIFEPASLVAAWVTVWFGDLQTFVAAQAPQWSSSPINESTSIVTLQLGNLYILLFMLGVVVLYGTTDLKLIRNYLIALAIADIGHVYATGAIQGWDAMLDVPNWNYMTWGNVGCTLFLFLNRVFYLLGFFAPVASSSGRKNV